MVMRSLVIASALIAAGTAHAEDGTELSEVLALVRAQAEEIAALKARLSALEGTHVPVLVSDRAAPASAPVTDEAPAPVSASVSKPSGFTIKPRGRIEADTVAYDSRDGRAYDDGAGFRRARLGVQGTLPGGFKYQIEADFAGGDKAKLDDTYLRYSGIEGTDITIGFHKIYHSLDSATSDLDVSFMERSMVSNAFEVGAGGKMGLSALTSGENWSFQYGVMLSSPNSGDADKDGWSVAGRATYAPIMAEGRLLHLGASAYVRHEDDELVSFADRPEIRNDSFKPYDSGTVAASRYTYLGGELAATYGSLTLQGEVSRMQTSADAGNHDFWGTTLQASYMLTGESKPYSGSKGIFGRLKPYKSIGEGGLGAVELALRFSHLDLRDGDTGTAGDTFTLGLNWYMTDAVRLMVNAVDFGATASGGIITAKGRAYGMRAQVRW
ncbi:OprO/OprP family phosphate-selective porin [Kordiimonas sp.]|uniref:OprO/OprP family phosphate-selective porin n=1 Tax=Kordiimonas sp. TaxID=1970157 RepID=UPI003A8EFA4A